MNTLVSHKKKLLYVSALLLLLFFASCASSGPLMKMTSSSGNEEESSVQEGKSASSGEGKGGTTETKDPAETKDTPEPQEQEETGLTVQSDPGGADVYIGGRYFGETPVTITDLDEGTYFLRLKRDGYYDLERIVDYSPGASMVLDLQMEQITGFLDIQGTPSDATVTLNGSGSYFGVHQLPIGSYRVRISAFGYKEESGRVSVYENSTTRFTADLERAPFEVSDFSLNRNVFNPGNPGSLGSVRASFKVTSWGNGQLQVFDEAGNQVWNKELPPFTTWDQSAQWTGTNSRGQRAPDGIYRVELSAESRDGKKSFTKADFVRLDSSLVYRYRPFWSGTAGLMYVPLPEVLPAGGGQVTVLANAAGDSANYLIPTLAGVRFAAGTASEIGISASVNVLTDTVAYDITASMKQQIAKGPLSYALYTAATWQDGTSADSYTRMTGVTAGISAALTAGPLTLAAAPELQISPFPVNYGSYQRDLGLYPRAYLRAGASLDLKNSVIGLSGAIRTTPFTQGFGIEGPAAAAAELHWYVPGTQAVLSLTSFGEFSLPPYTQDFGWYVGAGGGIGFLF